MRVALPIVAVYVTTIPIDWIPPGGLAEKPLKSAVVGPVFACILGRQYTKLRHTDRFWYEMDIPPSSLTISK